MHKIPTSRRPSAAALHALERANGNRAEAARQLGIGRQSLYARMANLGIERDG